MKIQILKNFLQSMVNKTEMFCVYRTKDTVFVSTILFHFMLPCDPTEWAYKKCPEQALSSYLPFVPDTGRVFTGDKSEDGLPQTAFDLVKNWSDLNAESSVDDLTLTPFLYEFGDDTYRIFTGTDKTRYFLNKKWCDCVDPKMGRYSAEYEYTLLENGWIRILQYVKTTNVRDAGQYAPVAYMNGTAFHSTERL